jgi:hypothetical protein
MTVLKSMTLTTLLGASLFPAISFAAESFSRVSKSDSFSALVLVDSQNVRCSGLGYGREELKISVPALAWWGVFDHRNAGETQPCMTAGPCASPWWDGLSVDDLIQDRPGPETVTIQRELVETFLVDHQRQHCERSLTENLTTELRGLNFRHSVSKDIGSLPFQSCLDIKAEL